MCGLFGFTIYKKDTNKSYTKLINALADNASVRGTHATGISYNVNGKAVVYKKPLPAYKINFKHNTKATAIMGHTRHATQGDAVQNQNNHPFKGKAGDTFFTLAHNGVLYNDFTLRKTHDLPKTSIKTDSYIMVQLIEKAGKLDFDALASCTELVSGYYTFTILDDKNNLYIIKGDSPMSIIQLTRLNMYVYASTDEILYKAIIDAGLFNEILGGHFNQIDIDEGDILKISPNGTITKGAFEIPLVSYYGRNWYEYSTTDTDSASWGAGDYNNDHFNDIVSVAKTLGYTENDIIELYNDGYTLDEIEEFLYCGEIVC